MRERPTPAGRWRAAPLLLALALAVAIATRNARPSEAAPLECPDLPSPPKGVTLTYYAEQPPFPPPGTTRTKLDPTWHATTHTFTLPLGTLAVLGCMDGKQLQIGNRTQPTGTFNRTCVQISSQLAAFAPSPPAGLLPSCKTVSRPNITIKPVGRCGTKRTPCGFSSCCRPNETCNTATAGVLGGGFCCPAGTTPCGAGELCCNAGEKCTVNTSVALQGWYENVACCSKGSTPCGTAACCYPGETCYPKIKQGQGLCCPGGHGNYTPCVSSQANTLVDGQPWECCAPGSTCTMTSRQQEQLRPSERAPPAKCCGKGTTACGLTSCCNNTVETCVDHGGGFEECVLKTFELCGPSKQRCPPGKCTAQGTCCTGLDEPCGKASCCSTSTGKCFASANQGQGLCCPLGQEPVVSATLNTSICCAKGSTACGSICCTGGQKCDSRSKPPACVPASTRFCGTQATCWGGGDVCWPDARQGRGACCGKGSAACGDYYCCDVGDLCVETKAYPYGTCCRPGEKLCGDTCCGSWGTCRNKTCVVKCPTGQSLCGSNSCCQPGYLCCGNMCCQPSQKCTTYTDEATGQVQGTCSYAGCPGNQGVCGSKCCATGQSCSADGLRCCSPRNSSCLLTGGSPTVLCGTSSYPANCSFWDQSCYLNEWGIGSFIPLCCADGMEPCGPQSNQCCKKKSPGLVQACDDMHMTCCLNGSTPCGGQCCGPDKWCHATYQPGPGDPGQSNCLPLNTKPCGHTACHGNQTCYSSARRGQGLCCPPGKVACRGVERPDPNAFPGTFADSGEPDWSYCCDP